MDYQTVVDAIQRGDTAWVESALDQHKIDVNAVRESDAFSYLHVAAAHKQPDIAEYVYLSMSFEPSA